MLELHWIPHEIFLVHKFQILTLKVEPLRYICKDQNLQYEHQRYAERRSRWAPLRAAFTKCERERERRSLEWFVSASANAAPKIDER